MKEREIGPDDVAVGPLGFGFVPRCDWGAIPPVRPWVRHEPNKAVLHHSWIPTTDQYTGPRTIRGIQRAHINLGWSDIGYHFIVSPDGLTVFEGRPVGVIGAHCGGRPPVGVERNFGNTGAIGICLLGDYDQEEPQEEALETLAIMLTRLADYFNFPATEVYPHFEAWSDHYKTCPGKRLTTAIFGSERWQKRWEK